MNLTHYEYRGEIVNKSDLIEAMSKDTGLTLTKAEQVVNTVSSVMANALAKGDRVEIRSFCLMFVK